MLRLRDVLRTNVEQQLERIVTMGDKARCVWAVVDPLLAVLRGTVRAGLLTDRKGLDTINAYACRVWLRMDGDARRTLDSAFVHRLSDISFAYEGGDFGKPHHAAGLVSRGTFRMFSTYRGSPLWKICPVIGDTVFAPFYEMHKKRGVSFQFFHRLENIELFDLDLPENVDRL